MIEVSVQNDIDKAIRTLNLLPKEAERAAYRSINKIADEIKKDSSAEIAAATGITRAKVLERMYVKGAGPNRLVAVVAALPSAKNVGKYDGANPTPKPAISRNAGAGVSLRAWGRAAFYDRTFVKGKQGSIGAVSRKVWRRTGKGPTAITDKVYGPSIRKTFEWPQIRRRQLEILKKRWPFWLQRYLRAEIVRLRGADALKGVTTVLPGLQGPTFGDGT